jgi:hypothetical protein
MGDDPWQPPHPAVAAPENERRAEPEAGNVNDRRRNAESDSPPPQSHMGTAMSDTPSRTEIAAQLQAAEARTETRIAQLVATIERRGAASDHKIDVLVGRVDALAAAVSEVGADVKADSRNTRTAVWLAALAVMGLVVALWVAGLNMQNNLIAAFQAGLSARSASRDVEPKGVPAPVPQAPPGKT